MSDPAFCAGLSLKQLGSGDHDVAAAARSGEPATGVRGPLAAGNVPDQVYLVEATALFSVDAGRTEGASRSGPVRSGQEGGVVEW
jgi:hypothetical protein